MHAYLDAPFLRKLFGYGMNQFPFFIQAYEAEMLERFLAVFVDAHNEYLQILSMMGFVGFAGYFGMFLGCIKCCVDHLCDKKAVMPMLGIMVCAAYLVQGIANSPQVFTTPLYFVVLGIIIGECSG